MRGIDLKDFTFLPSKVRLDLHAYRFLAVIGQFVNLYVRQQRHIFIEKLNVATLTVNHSLGQENEALFLVVMKWQSK